MCESAFKARDARRITAAEMKYMRTAGYIWTDYKNSFSMYVYFYSLHVSGSHVLINRRINCINTTSGICHSDRLLSSIQSDIPDVLIQLILLMMGTWLPETCRE